MIPTALAFLYQVFGSHRSARTEASTPSYHFVTDADGSLVKVANA